jgi:FG-GAP-like repeat
MNKFHSEITLAWFVSMLFLTACGGGNSSNLTTLGGLQGRNLEVSDQYTFGPLSSITGQPIYEKTVIGDFNGDGRNDVATFTNWTINGADLVVMYQEQDGTFKTFVSFNTITDLGLNSINDIAVGDLNGDGRIDLAVLGNPLPQTVGAGPPLVVLYQDSAGNLGSPTSVTVFSDPLAIGGRLAIGDMNADGRDDVVVGGNPMMVVLQDSDGNLGTGTGSIFSLNAYSTFAGELHIADMDSDGNDDLVFQDGNKSIGILRQTSPGIFSGAVEHYQVVTSYWNSFNTFEVGDVNGDGKNDIVALDPGNDGYLNIFPQNGSGTLNAPQLVTITSSPLYGIEIADINKDGLNDIIGDVVDAGYPTGLGQIHVFYQKSDHTFQNSTTYYFPTSGGGGSSVYQALSIGDVNGDGWPDAVVSWIDEGIFELRNVPL